MNTLYTINQSTLLNILEPWEFQVSSGFVVRGYKSTPSGKPVIHFIHGNGYSGLVYQQLLLTLSKHYDLFLINIQGHGNSDLGGYFRGWNENARYCLEAWNYFKREWQTVPRIAMGHSLGGILSLLMMSENVLAFDKAILLDPVLFTPLQMGFMSIAKPIGLLKKSKLVKRTLARRTSWSNKQDAFDYFYQRGMFRGWENACLWDYINYAMQPGLNGKNWQLVCPPKLEADVFASYPKNLWRSLNKVQTPCWILYGDRTYPMVEQSAKKLASKHRNYQIQSFQGGHCFMQENPSNVGGSILKILKHQV